MYWIIFYDLKEEEKTLQTCWCKECIFGYCTFRYVEYFYLKKTCKTERLITNFKYVYKKDISTTVDMKALQSWR